MFTSILNATQSDFSLLYQQKYPEVSESFKKYITYSHPRPSKEDFVEDYMARKTLAEEDLRTLHQLGISHGDIRNRLNTIFAKANSLANQSLASPDKESFLKHPVIEFEEGGVTFRISGFGLAGIAAQQLEECALCDYTEKSGLKEYTLQNVGNGEKAVVRPLSLHILTHDYCAREGVYRIDPKQFAKLLNLTS